MEKEGIHISEAIDGLREWFMERYCQLFLILPNGKVKAEGSGFFLEIENEFLLVTAGHVIADGRHNNICFPNLKSGGMSNFQGVWFPSDRLNNIGLDPDDYAYLKLPKEIVIKLEQEGYKFIKEQNIDIEHTPSDNYIYTMIGCKWRKTKKRGIDHYSQMEILTNFGGQKHLYKNEIASQNKIIVKNNKKMLNPRTESQQILGKLDGMSGGPIWHTDLFHYYSLPNPNIKLVGILHTYEYTKIVSCNIKRLYNKLLERKYL